MSEEKRIEASIKGIKCDNPSCDFHDDIVAFEDRKDWLNKHCPLCGGNLLTQDDFDRSAALLAAADYINSLTEEQTAELLKSLGLEDDRFKPNGEPNDKYLVEVDTHKKLSVKSITKIEDND